MPRMTKKLAADLLKAVLPINEKIEMLNYGSCGVFAVSFAQLLKDMGFVDVQIWSMETYDSYSNTSNHPSNVERLRDARNNNYEPRTVKTHCHYMVRLGDWFFDSETATKKSKIRKGVTVTVDGDEETYFPVGDYAIEDIAFANRFQFLWNRNYNRAQNKKVDKFFEQLKKKFVCTTPSTTRTVS